MWSGSRQACAKRRIPLTVRAGGTGNYGQAVPLEGGVLLDVSGLSATEWVKPGIVRVGPGARMHELDAELRATGYEIRMHPSTKRMATIGGFIAGGSGGVGSVTWGVLRDPGNLIAARIVTMEEEPRVLELRGRDVQAVNHGYGTTGIITALEVPTAPVWDWMDVIVTFDDFMEAVAFGRELAMADGIAKKLVTPMDAPITAYFPALQEACPAAKSVIFCMIAAPAMESFRTLLGDRGQVTYEVPFDEGPGHEPLYEYTWNHTTLQWLKQDRSVTYLQCLFPADRLLESVAEMREMFRDEVYYHLEFIRFAGKVTCSSLPVVRFTTEERLNEIIRLHEEHGVMIANPHVWTLEDGTRHKKADADQLGFKAGVDPYGLLNPGKMRSFVPTRA
jgi:FAD/FMN-containing dehydrogenase